MLKILSKNKDTAQDIRICFVSDSIVNETGDGQNIRIREIPMTFANEAQLLDVSYIELFESLSLDESIKKR